MGEPTFFKEILFVALSLAGVGMFALCEDKLRAGFILFVALLGLGYRTYPLTPVLKLIPAELVLAALPLLLAGRGVADGGVRRGLPRWLLLMMPFWLLAWLPSSTNVYPWDARLAEFRNFLLLVPLFVVTPVVLARPSAWRAAVLAFCLVSTVISVLGLLEHYLPGVARAVPGFMGNSDPILAGEFKRASFSFYGSPIAVFICSVALPLGLALWRWWPSPICRAATLASALLQCAAIYISGYRSMWLILALQVMICLAVKRQVGLAALFVWLGLAGYGALPQATRDRVTSLQKVLEGKPEVTDSSGKKRWSRAIEAFDAACDRPLGNGWAAAGWVHSDFLQVAANQGIVPGLIFLGGYIVALVRLGWRSTGSGLPPDFAALGLGLFISFVAVGGILLYEGVQFLPQTILPVWLVWVLAETWLCQAAALATRPEARAAAPLVRRQTIVWRSVLSAGRKS